MCFVSAVCYGFGINITKKEHLPFPFMLRHRVLCEGIARIYGCVIVGRQIRLDYKVNCADENEENQEAWDAAHQRSAELLLDLCERHGALYVKAGQGFAAMNHLLPRQYCETLVKLQDKVVFRPYSEIRYVIEQELGKGIRDVFSSFDEKPIAAASMAQVHRAVLKSGEEVAVKVQYIDVKDRFDADMFVITSFLKIAAWFNPGFDFAKVMSRTETMLRAELNFTEEADNCRRCGAEMEKVFRGQVTTPRVFDQLTTERMMTMEFIHGVKANDREAIEGMGLRSGSIRTVGRLFADAFAHQIFVTGSVHADPHPGNVFVRPLPTDPSKPQLVILDHGLYSQLSDSQRLWVAQVWTASVTHDDDKLKATCEYIGLPRDAFAMLGSLFLCFPYHSFDPFRRVASKCAVQEQQLMARKQIWRMTIVLDKLPPEITLVLRNINTARSVVKDLGNPVSRSVRMLRCSMAREQADTKTSAWNLRCAIMFVVFREMLDNILATIAEWRDPQAAAEVASIYQLG